MGWMWNALQRANGFMAKRKGIMLITVCLQRRVNSQETGEKTAKKTSSKVRGQEGSRERTDGLLTREESGRFKKQVGLGQPGSAASNLFSFHFKLFFCFFRLQHLGSKAFTAAGTGFHSRGILLLLSIVRRVGATSASVVASLLLTSEVSLKDAEGSNGDVLPNWWWFPRPQPGGVGRSWSPTQLQSVIGLRWNTTAPTRVGLSVSDSSNLGFGFLLWSSFNSSWLSHCWLHCFVPGREGLVMRSGEDCKEGKGKKNLASRRDLILNPNRCKPGKFAVIGVATTEVDKVWWSEEEMRFILRKEQEFSNYTREARLFPPIPSLSSRPFSLPSFALPSFYPRSLPALPVPACRYTAGGPRVA